MGVQKDMYTPRRCAVALVLAGILTGLGFAVRWAEFNQVGSSNHVSLWIFVFAGLFAYYAAIVAFVILRRYLNSRRSCAKIQHHFAKGKNKDTE